MILCPDGLSGMKESIRGCLSKDRIPALYLSYINTMKYVPDKDRKAFAADLRTIYQAPDELKVLTALERVTEK